MGKTVFGNGSYAPNRGTNNPAGYIKREINKQGQEGINKQGPFGGVSNFGSTGRSETRSGLARRALERQGSKEPSSSSPSNGFIKQKPSKGSLGAKRSLAPKRKRMIITKYGALKLGDS